MMNIRKKKVAIYVGCLGLFAWLMKDPDRRDIFWIPALALSLILAALGSKAVEYGERTFPLSGEESRLDNSTSSRRSLYFGIGALSVISIGVQLALGEERHPLHLGKASIVFFNILALGIILILIGSSRPKGTT